MLIILIPILIGTTTIILASFGDELRMAKHENRFGRWCFKHGNIWGFTAFMSIAMIVIAMMLLIGNHIDYASFPTEYQAVKTTIQASRTDANDIERAAVVHKVIEINKEFAKVKYWNDSLWVGWFWPDRVANLKYIQ